MDNRRRRLKRPRHGHTKGGPSPTYNSWRCMMARCHDPKHRSYPDYGGAGIKVVKRWHKFVNFLKDMGERPSIGHTLGRSTPFSDYGPREVSWQTKHEQNVGLKDQSKDQVEIIDRETGEVTKITKRELADRLGIKYKSLCRRLLRGWSKEEAFEATARQARHTAGRPVVTVQLDSDEEEEAQEAAAQ